MSELHDELEREFADVEQQLVDPELVKDRSLYAQVTRRYKELGAIVACITDLGTAEQDVADSKEMHRESSGEDRVLWAEEISLAEATAADAAYRLDELLIPKDPNDGRNVIVEIRGAEGGEEANLFARDLFEMYRSYASTQPWRQEMLEANHSDMGGFSTVIFLLKGEAVWSHLKYEGGVHRVQRVPVTESQGRVHTSSATVSVLPEADEVDISINEGDLQVDVYRASGPGGQSVNTTDSAVRITHKPSGLVVSMQDEKSQLQNKAKAMQVLRARLLQAEQDKAAAEASDLRKGQIGGGGRSEKIRTYNYKENRVTDHRIGLTLYKLDKVLAGALEEVVDPLMQHERAEQLSANEE
ncbi:MAG: peptide chain release factor 1 [Acidimicrobiales bacterium]